MIRVIADKEFKDCIRDGRFRAVAAAMILLLAASLIHSVRGYSAAQAERDSARAANQRQFGEQGRKNPHGAAHFGFYIFKPTPALGALDPGVEPWMGATLWLEAHKQNDFIFRPAHDRGVSMRFGELTPAFLLQTLMPLLIVFLSFGSIASERESGTLKQILAQGNSAVHLAWGKWLGLARAMGLILVPAVLCAAGMMMSMSPPGEVASSALRFILWLAAYGVYLSTFLAASIAVSAVCSSARMACVAGLILWGLTVLVIPRTASAVARRVAPAPSAVEFAATVRKEMGGHHDAAMTERFKLAAFQKYGVSRIEDLPGAFSGIELIEGERAGDAVFDRRYGELDAIMNRQTRIRTVFGLVSPMLAVREISQGLSETNYSAHRDFASAGERYRREYIQFLNEDILKNARRDLLWDADYTGSSELWKSVPVFTYRQPGLSSIARRQILSAGVLLAGLALASGALHLSASRIRPA